MKDLKNKPTVMKLEGLSIVAEVTDHIEFSEADELKYKQYLLESIESKREAKVGTRFISPKSLIFILGFGASGRCSKCRVRHI